MTLPQNPSGPPEQRRAVPMKPVWAGPLGRELPFVVHSGQFLHRGPGRMMAVQSIEVFSTGCMINVVWAVWRTNESEKDWEAVRNTFFQPGRPRSGASDPESGLLFGISFPDGRTATHAHASGLMSDRDDPEFGAILALKDQRGHGDHEELAARAQLWVWPLPENGDLRFTAQWNDIGISKQSVLLDGTQLRTAAAVVQGY